MPALVGVGANGGTSYEDDDAWLLPDGRAALN
jgi:hypothetical protein